MTTYKIKYSLPGIGGYFYDTISAQNQSLAVKLLQAKMSGAKANLISRV